MIKLYLIVVTKGMILGIVALSCISNVFSQVGISTDNATFIIPDPLEANYAGDVNVANPILTSNYMAVDEQSNTINLKVMQFNIWLEGTKVPNGLMLIKNIIDTVNPDIVCFSEVANYSGDWTTKVVNELAAVGKNYYRGYVAGEDVSIISKYPISLSGPILEGAIVVFHVNINGTTVVVCPSHLDYTYYATYLPRGYACGGSGIYAGWSALSPFVPVTNLSVISDQNIGSQRDEQIAAFISYMQNETRPILLVGDFNEPSCLDWTTKQAELYDHNGVVFQWPTTLALKDNGFIDAYRQVYPDEVLNPGISWPAVASGVSSTCWAPLSDERDRIDYIFYKGAGVTAIAAAIVGPQESYVKNVASILGNGNDVFEASTLPWPSDHKAVTATISIPVSTAISSYSNTIPEICIYPNPSNGLIRVVSSNSIASQIIITDTAGREILSEKLTLTAGTDCSLDISSMQNGIYFISIISQNTVKTIKIVKGDY